MTFSVQPDFPALRSQLAPMAASAGADLDRISFKGTIYTLRQWHTMIASAPLRPSPPKGPR